MRFLFLLFFACWLLGVDVCTAHGQGPVKKSPVSVSAPKVQSSSINASSINTSPVFLTGLVKTEDYRIDLPTVLKLTEQQNLDIAQFRQATRVTRTQFYESAVQVLPSLVETLDINHLKGGVQIFSGQPVTVDRKTFQPQLTANWLIYPGGTHLFQALAAKRREKVSKYALTETYQQQLANAASAYYQWLSAQAQVQNVLKDLEETRRQVALSEARLAAGVGIKLDVLKARDLQAQQENFLVQAKAAVGTTEQELLDRLNLDTSIHLMTDEPNDQQRALLPANSDVQRLLKETIRNHPTVRRVNEELRALKADLYTAVSQLVPAVNLRYYVNRTGPSSDNTVVTHYYGFNVTALLLGNMGLTVPLQIREQAQRVKQKELEQKATIRTIERQVVDAYLDSQSYASGIVLATEQRDLAEESLRLASGRYSAGLGIALDVSDAQTRLTNARTLLTQAILNYNQAQVHLVQALGLASPQSLIRGWQGMGKASP